ncbi:UDP-N-acetylmuramoyl-L-alanine--D-glutamate ligase [Aquella oligotrophica]|uniref:UDP-N-acetylmuramoylalanine--D-glutamate ligase n=1 Tax=Aquella oligotrophica TaxID=2067065 RepID=A0A2I7N3Z4_9NEIS|nr:UDP-N-acetylmuramoyl-L-alanine--D-glutamate ligase [Aquella oligotrophica]AUR51151.1 UDP-N-acetylmuramoyl-L-alanine--D-glutamate ligase [Aquella oligotrophica]
MRKIDFSQETFVIIGAGETGRSIYRYLSHRKSNIINVLDTRDTPPEFIDNVAVVGGKLDYKNLEAATVVVVSPGVSIYEPAIQEALANNKQVVGDIELFAQEISAWDSKVIGITGSNGKTTVTSLTGFLASELGVNTLVAGNIGTPVLDALISIEASNTYPELIVLELSSFQLETTHSLMLDSATVLNISEDHLDRYRDLLEYAYAKANIFNNCKVQILNLDDPLVMSMSRSHLPQTFFGSENAEYSLIQNTEGLFLAVNNIPVLNTEKLQLVGRHNYQNSLASLALLVACGYQLADLLEPLTKFAGLEHRMQKIAEAKNVIYIEDSKGTNVGAVIAGVSGIDRPVHLILGGDGKGQDFTPLRTMVKNKCKSVALIGQDANKIAEVLDGVPSVAKYSTLEDAIAACHKNAVAGDAVILSPACASWDMFTNYKHRAQVFSDTVNALIQKNP